VLLDAAGSGLTSIPTAPTKHPISLVYRTKPPNTSQPPPLMFKPRSHTMTLNKHRHKATHNKETRLKAPPRRATPTRQPSIHNSTRQELGRSEQHTRPFHPLAM